MLCVQSHHTAKQFLVFAITSNEVHFCKEFFKEKIPEIYLSATMNKISLPQMTEWVSLVFFKRLQT